MSDLLGGPPSANDETLLAARVTLRHRRFGATLGRKPLPKPL
jgi:hypothetical protein